MNKSLALYNDLMALCDGSDAFYFVDRIVGLNTYRVFNYRLTSWTEMQRPNAKNCRGTTFSMVGDNMLSLASLPPEKFFNYEEGDQDHTRFMIGCVMNKLDGSLISTVGTGGKFLLKSKSSFDSEQALAATQWINDSANYEFWDLVDVLDSMGFTVNMEWTSPENRIVVPYQESRLTILNIRDSLPCSEAFGKPYCGDSLKARRADLFRSTKPEFFVDHEILDTLEHIVIFGMKEEEVGEGYVVEIQHPEGSYLVKVKNHKYLSLHKTKDSVNTPSKLYEAVIMEYSDDLRGLFGDDAFSLAKINAMEELVIPKFNFVVHMVETFYEQFGKMDRKSYAIHAKQEQPTLMSLCMNLYLGKENDYKAFALKHPDIFGLSDEVL